MTRGRKQAKTGSEIVAASQQRVIESGGGRSPNVMFTPDEMARWRALEDRIGGDERGRSKRTMLAAMAALEGRNAISAEDVIAWVRAHDTIPLNRSVKVKG